MEKDLKYYLDTYQQIIRQGDMQIAYIEIMNYFIKLRNSMPASYSVSEITAGYLDFSYFTIHDDFLYDRYLKFIVALNHQTLGIELWLTAQNDYVENRYRRLIADSEWIKYQLHETGFGLIEVSLAEYIQPNQADIQIPEMLQLIEQYVSHIENFLYTDEI